MRSDSLPYFAKIIYNLRRTGSSLFTYDCAHCGKAVRGRALCEECEKLLMPAAEENENTVSVFYYDSAAKSALLKHKFSGCDYCADTLCDWLCVGFEKLENQKFDFALPVPSFGVTETKLYYLVKDFCAAKEIPFKPSVLKKIRKTEKQHNLSAKDRKENLKDAFKASSAVAGKTVLLIDDILTTGTTVSECSKTLLEAGAEKVFVLTVLKTKFDYEE